MQLLNIDANPKTIKGRGAARVLLAADAIGVIMPLRADKPVLDTPAWLERPAAKLSAVA
jgi:hypothetical protein